MIFLVLGMCDYIIPDRCFFLLSFLQVIYLAFQLASYVHTKSFPQCIHAVCHSELPGVYVLVHSQQ